MKKKGVLLSKCREMARTSLMAYVLFDGGIKENKYSSRITYVRTCYLGKKISFDISPSG